jgi:glycosyltransferase involved in cell wall biosynthesis
MRNRLAGVRVLYVQYTNPAAYPPIHHSARMLADEGAVVRMLGTSRAGDPLRVPAHDRIAVSLMRFEPAGWRQKLHYARFAAWVVLAALRWQPTWVYASDPLSCPIGWLIARLTRARIAYHEHDSPAESSGRAADPSGFWRMVMRARRRVGRESELCILPNAARAAAFRALSGRERDVLTVWNCPMPVEAAAARRPRADGRMRVVYHGSIVPARLGPAVLEALAGLPPAATLDVIGYETVGHRGYVDRLKVLAAELGIAGRVTFHGAMSRDALMRGCAEYDVGLSLLPTNADDPNQQTMTGASNKPFDYLAAGLALLVTDRPEWQRMFVEPGFARDCTPESVESIRTSLRWLLEHPRERAAMGERGRQRILAEWNYERQFAPVLARMRAGHRAGEAQVADLSSPARG